MNQFGRAVISKVFIITGILVFTAGAGFGQSTAPASGEKKATHVITDDDMNSGTYSAKPSQSSAAQPASHDESGTNPDAAGSTPAEATDAAANEEMSKHQAGGPVPNESPKDAIKRLEREEDELRSKLDSLRQKAETETSDNRRRMWLEAVDHQQVTLQEMREERTKLQKSEDEKAAAGNADSGSTSDQSGTGTAPQ